MVTQAEKSVTRTIAKAMLLIVLLSIVTTTLAIVTLASSLNDAEAVNVSGSMRMQSYRLSHDIQQQSPEFESHLKIFEQSLLSPSMQALESWGVPKDITSDYRAIISRWDELKQNLLSSNRMQYIDIVADFVSQIDGFVYKLQRHSERKLIALAWVGSLGLGGILIASIYVVHFIRKEVVKPLKALLVASRRIQNHSFDVVLNSKSQNEMGILTNTFNHMAQDLGKLYRGMELAVYEKTRELQNANNALKVLYDSSQQLTASRIGEDNFKSIIANMVNIDGIAAVRLEVGENSETSWNLEHGDMTGACENNDSTETASLPLILDNQKLGELTWCYFHPNYDAALISSFAQMLARAIYFNQAQRQAEQIILMEERATIARELHDSLAQSLSYLKIQMSLLKRGLKTQSITCDQSRVQPVIGDIDKGLSDAYIQLRELLTTFRLTIKEGNFDQALEGMLQQLNDQSSVAIKLTSYFSTQTLDAHQQVHLLQLIREAVLNAIKHADATEIKINCIDNHDSLVLQVVDDGKGFDKQEAELNHYGVAIMRERAERLGGELTLDSSPNQGCTVTLTYNKPREGVSNDI
ncbi:nitrate/nitrite two-component system sensor histidine kinase NarQ [Vibrio sp. RC27]